MTQDTSGPQLDHLRRRHRDFYLEMAEEARTHIWWQGFWVDSSEEQAWLDALEEDRDNIRTAIRWTIDREDTEGALRFGVALGGFWSTRRHIKEGRQLLDAILELDGEVNEGLAIDASSVSGLLAMEDGDFEEARTRLGEAADLARASEDEARLIRCLVDLAWVETYDGRPEHSGVHAEEALRRARGLGDPALLSRSIDAALWNARKDGHEAIERYERELRQLVPHIPARVWFDQLETIATCWAHAGDFDRYGRIQREEFVPLARQLDDPQYLAYGLGNLASWESRKGDIGSAAAHFEEAHRAARAAGITTTAVAFLLQLAYIAIDDGRYTTAEILAGEGLTTLKELPGPTWWDRDTIDRLYDVMELALIARGELTQARASVDARIAAHSDRKPWKDANHPLTRRVMLSGLAGDAATAIADLRRLIEASEAEPPGEVNPAIRPYVHRCRAELAIQEGRLGDAIEEWRAGLDRLRATNEAFEEIPFLIELGRTYLLAGNLGAAAEILTDAATKARDRGRPRASTDALYVLADVETQRGNTGAAARHLREALRDEAVWLAPIAVTRIEILARYAEAAGEPQLAIRLLSAATAARERMRMNRKNLDAPDPAELLTRLRDHANFGGAWGDGAELTLQEARADATALLNP